MAGRSWRDLKRQNQNKTTAKTQGGADSFSGANVRNGQSALAQKNAAQSTIERSPRLSKLMEERKSLEDKMNMLSAGGDQLSPRDSARFSVPSFSQRRAEQQEWDQRRDSASRRSALRNATSQGAASQQSAGSGEDLSQWLTNRDQQRSSLRDSARDRLSSVNNTRSSISRGIDSLNNMSRQLDQIDQMSIDQGQGGGTGMEALNTDSLGSSRLGSSRLNSLNLDDRASSPANRGANTGSGQNGNRSGNSELNDLRKKINQPLDEIKKIEKSWEDKRDKISGAMDKIGPYVNNLTRRLSVDEGGSGNIFERMKKNKAKALERRKERIKEEEKDEKRRERASKNRREKDKEKE